MTVESKTKSRTKNIDDKIYGAEPVLSGSVSKIDIINAYNWYSSQYDSDKAKTFVLSYLRKEKKPRNYIKKVSEIPSYKLQNIGWNLRIIGNGGTLPDDIVTSAFTKLDSLVNQVVEVEEKKEEPKKVVSVKERVECKTSELISLIEDEVDSFILNGKSTFKMEDWLKSNNVKPTIAKKVGDYYRPLYAELYEALNGNNQDLKYAYGKWKKVALKKYLEFIKTIISATETFSVENVKVRKPRQKKAKPASAVVSKVQYKISDEDYKIKSIAPTNIIGASQLWLFNCKTRDLSVIISSEPTGLTVTGTTIKGYDTNTSICKTLRKPEETIQAILSGTKASLKKIMPSIKTKEKPAKSRLNTDVIILKAIK